MLTDTDLLRTIARNAQAQTQLLIRIIATLEVHTGLHVQLTATDPTPRIILPPTTPPTPKTCRKCGQPHSPDKPGSTLWENMGEYICDQCLNANPN